MDRFSAYYVIFIVALGRDTLRAMEIGDLKFYSFSWVEDGHKVIFSGSKGESFVHVSSAEKGLLLFVSKPKTKEELGKQALRYKFENIEVVEQDGPRVDFLHDSHVVTIGFSKEATAKKFHDDLKRFIKK